MAQLRLGLELSTKGTCKGDFSMRCGVLPLGRNISMRPGWRREPDLNDGLNAIFDQIERLKVGIRAKVEHSSRLLKRQLGYTKTRYPGSIKNTAQITMLFALGNLWFARKALQKS